MRQSIEPPPGWETGRASEPAMMDLNLHATRSEVVVPGVQPKVVVWQHDAHRPLNPCGFLVAYEEARAQPHTPLNPHHTLRHPILSNPPSHRMRSPLHAHAHVRLRVSPLPPD
jgi:hypothetical protein